MYTIFTAKDLAKQTAAAAEQQSMTAGGISKNVNEAASGISQVNDNVAQASAVADKIARDIADVSMVSKKTK